MSKRWDEGLPYGVFVAMIIALTIGYNFLAFPEPGREWMLTLLINCAICIICGKLENRRDTFLRSNHVSDGEMVSTDTPDPQLIINAAITIILITLPCILFAVRQWLTK